MSPKICGQWRSVVPERTSISSGPNSTMKSSLYVCVCIKLNSLTILSYFHIPLFMLIICAKTWFNTCFHYLQTLRATFQEHIKFSTTVKPSIVLILIVKNKSGSLLLMLAIYTSQLTCAVCIILGGKVKEQSDKGNSRTARH